MRWGVQMRLVALFKHRRDDGGAAAVEFAEPLVVFLQLGPAVLRHPAVG